MNLLFILLVITNFYSYDIYIKKYCRSFDINLVKAIIFVESSWKEKALGKKVKVKLIRNNKYVYEWHKAIGLMQVMSFHSKDINLLYEPEFNIKKGCQILEDCFKKNKSTIKALSCYNMGINNKKYNKKYVLKVLKKYGEYSRL